MEISRFLSQKVDKCLLQSLNSHLLLHIEDCRKDIDPSQIPGNCMIQDVGGEFASSCRVVSKGNNLRATHTSII